MKYEGFMYAAMAAVGHSCIDASRKLAAQKFTSTELVGLVGLLDAALLSSVVFGTGMFDSHTLLHMVNTDLFLEVLIGSACIKVLVGYMYQRALHVSPLSVTVPYLAFTPVLLVFTGYLVMRESPSSQGLAGVGIVTLGGYLLAIDQSGDSEIKKLKSPKGLAPSESFLASVLPSLAILKPGEKKGGENEQVLVIVDEKEDMKDAVQSDAGKNSWKMLNW